MYDSFSSIWGHSVHFANFPQVFKRLFRPQFSSNFNETILWIVWQSGENTGYYIFGDLSNLDNLLQFEN